MTTNPIPSKIETGADNMPCDDRSKSTAAPPRITFGAQGALLLTPQTLPIGISLDDI